MRKPEVINRMERNAKIIRWWNAQPEETQLNIRMFYAGHLQCPLAEITEEMLNPEDLDFIWSNFQKQIE